jgi:hypothetical protein
MSGCYHFCSQVKRQYAFLSVSFEHWRCVADDKSETLNFWGEMYSCQVWSVTNRSEMNKNVTRMRTKFGKIKENIRRFDDFWV